MRLAEREDIVLGVLEQLPPEDIVLIGGYGLNAYVPPRFSVDCDLVVLDQLDTIQGQLVAEGFVRTEQGEVPYGNYLRYVRRPERVSFDLMTGEVLDRETGVAFDGALVEKHSRLRTTVGRTRPIRIQVRVADPELLFAMKFVPARRQDIRDLFMLSGEELDRELIKRILIGRCTATLIAQRAEQIKETITSNGYRDSLQGPYGKIPDEQYDRCMARLVGFLDELVRSVDRPQRS